MNETVFHLKWQRYGTINENSDIFVTNSTFCWKNFVIKIDIHCFWGKGPGGYRAHYHFSVNGLDYHYNMIDSYVKAKNGELPIVEGDGKRLVFIALPTYITVEEQEL